MYIEVTGKRVNYNILDCNMKLHLENLSKIKEADIEINGITVIAGENNTGKSSLGKALYSIYGAFYDMDHSLELEKFNALRVYLRRRLKVSNRLRNLNDLTKMIIAVESEVYENKEELSKKLDAILNAYSEIDNFHFIDMDEIKEYIFRLLNTDYEELRKKVVEKYLDKEFNEQVQSLNAQKNTIINLKLKGDEIFIEYKQGHDMIIHNYIPIIHRLVYIDNPKVLDDVATGIFASNILNHEESLANLLAMDKEQTIFDELLAKDNLNRVLNKIHDVIKGEFFETEDEVGFLEEGSEEFIKLANLSMGVKSFAIIKKLIENGYIEKNGIIVLDEPEVHLHPKWQLDYAEILVILQKELDLNIVLTTHSPYFINAIEAFSVKYGIDDKTKYYLSELDDNRAYFSDVTMNIDKIYQKLAAPLQTLEDIL